MQRWSTCKTTTEAWPAQGLNGYGGISACGSAGDGTMEQISATNGLRWSGRSTTTLRPRKGGQNASVTIAGRARAPWPRLEYHWEN